MEKAMRSKGLTSCAAVMLLAIWSNDSQAAGKFKTINPPQGSNAAAQAINKVGDIAGVYYDGDNNIRSFIRIAGGSYTTFGFAGSTYFSVVGINDVDTVAGSFGNNEGTHGFIRTSNGTFTQVDVPGNNESTDIEGLNEGGASGLVIDPALFAKAESIVAGVTPAS
jgi:hypothetical protein